MKTNLITFSDNTEYQLECKQSVYFDLPAFSHDLCYVDHETGEVFFGVPSSLSKLDNFGEIWDSVYGGKAIYQCSSCKVNILHDTLCCLMGSTNIETDQIVFYCNVDCEDKLVNLDFTFEGETIQIRDAYGGVELESVFDMISQHHNVYANQLALSGFDADDCLGAVAMTEERHIVLRVDEDDDASEPFQLFRNHCGTKEDQDDDRMYLDELRKDQGMLCWASVMDFIRFYYSNPDLPAIVGPSYIIGCFYVDNDDVLRFFEHPELTFEMGGDKFALCYEMLKKLFVSRKEAKILKDEEWKPWYQAFEASRDMAQYQQLRRLFTNPNVSRKRAREPVDDSNLHTDNMYGTQLLSNCTALRGEEWFIAFRRLYEKFTCIDKDFRVPLHTQYDDKHVALRRGSICFSKKLRFGKGTPNEQRAFLKSIADTFTAKWTNGHLMNFKEALETDESFGQWCNVTQKAFLDLRQDVQDLLDSVDAQQDSDKWIAFKAIVDNYDSTIDHLDRDSLNKVFDLFDQKESLQKKIKNDE